MTALYDLHDTPASAAGPRRPLFGDERALMRVALILWLALTAWKLALAFAGNVVWEESHFVVSGSRPDLAYPDVPAGWPLFARLAAELFGWSPLAVRAPGLAVAQLIPLGVFFLAEPLVGRRNAIWAAIASMLLPPLGVSGTILYPEGALQLLMALMLGCAVRAVRTNGLAWWIGTGAAGALGLFVHYRIGVIGLAVVLYAVATADGRKLFARPGLWIAGLIAAAGLVPALLYNMREGWPSTEYHAVNRHVWEFNVAGLFLHLLEQVALCTPVFFLGLFWAARDGVREWMDGDQAAGLVVATGVLVFLLFAALAPFYRTRLPHWPFLGYVALIPWLPGALIAFVDAARSPRQHRWRTLAVASGPALAVAGAIGMSVFVLAWANAERVPIALRPLLESEMEDWTRLEAPIARATAAASARLGDPAPVLVASGHIPAVRLEFPGAPGRRVYGLDEPYDGRTRFGTLRADLGLDRAALLRDHPGRAAVIALLEPTFLYHQPEEAAFRAELCRLFEGVRLENVEDLPPARQSVSIYTARLRSAPGAAGAPCPFLPPLYIARPERAQAMESGATANFYGMAADPAGFVRVDVLLDGRMVTRARTGLDVAGSRAPAALAFDPAYPRVQLDFQLPAASLTPGAHRLSLRGVRADGSVVEGAGRTIYVR